MNKSIVVLLVGLAAGLPAGMTIGWVSARQEGYKRQFMLVLSLSQKADSGDADAVRGMQALRTLYQESPSSFSPGVEQLLPTKK